MAADDRTPAARAFTNVDAVVNVVGEEINQRLTDEAKQRIRESRVTASRNLLQGIAALEKRRRPSSVSRRSAITARRGAKILDEESQPGEGFGSELPVE